MNSNEWPLVFFTLLSQISTGILFAGLIVFVFTRSHLGAGTIELKRLVITTAFIIAGIALVLSFLHLARPKHAVFALQNIGTSHLSLEILMVSVFVFLLMAAWSSERFNFPPTDFFNYLFLAALFSGLLVIWSMAKLYIVPTIPAWNTPLTFVRFYNSGLLLGTGAVLLMVVYLYGKDTGIFRVQHILTTLFLLISLGVFIHLLTTLIAAPAPDNITSGFPLPVIPAWIKIGRALLLLVGFLFILWWFRGFLMAGQSVQPVWAYLGFLMLFFAEIVARYIFYTSYYRVGV
jgi:anaerobic dimethyl sulfoxide reductase subunit C